MHDFERQKIPHQKPAGKVLSVRQVVEEAVREEREAIAVLLEAMDPARTPQECAVAVRARGANG